MVLGPTTGHGVPRYLVRVSLEVGELINPVESCHSENLTLLV